MELELRTRTIEQAYKEWDYEYVKILYEEYDRESSGVSQEMWALIEVKDTMCEKTQVLIDRQVMQMDTHLMNLVRTREAIRTLISDII